MVIQYLQHRLGTSAEERAHRYLKQQGLTAITKNFRCKLGEIDLIMQDKETLVFVEVRYRTRGDFGSSLESITRQKQIKIMRAATVYLQQRKLYEKIPCRFDVVAIMGVGDNLKIDWVKSAFQYE